MSQRAVLAIAFFVVALPLWFGFAWVIGLMRFGTESVIEGPPAFEQPTELGAEEVRSCLLRDYSNALTLTLASSPTPQTSRLRNRPARIVVDISALHGGAIVRVYRLDGAPLHRSQVLAVQSCIPEIALSHPSDPRNRDFYSQ